MKEITTSRRAPFGANPTVGDTGRATQQRILAAAAEAFAETGYANTSVEAITDRAGCSRPTFYQYFSGKEDLHRRLAGRLGAELGDAIDRLAPVTPDAAGRAALRDWLADLAAISSRYRAVTSTFSASIRTDDRMVSGAASLSARYRRALRRELDTSASSGDTDVEVVAGAAIVMAYGAAIAEHPYAEIDSERLADALADTMHRTFFGPLTGVNVSPLRRGTRPPATKPASDRDDPDPPRHDRGRQTKQRLLDAAKAAYGTLGFTPVRVDDIATEAGVSHGTFYRYFRDTEAIYSVHLADTFDELLQLLERLRATDTLAQPAAAARAWAADYYRFYGDHRAIVACLRDAIAAGATDAARAGVAITVSLAKALQRRSFGDTDVDVVVLRALLDHVPPRPTATPTSRSTTPSRPRP
ncbi:MAG: TetR/AcrR family transcriptional regulator [Acidimicrobiales bacterium]